MKIVDGWVQEFSVDGKYRYCIGEPKDRNIVCIGLNPSDGAKDKPDSTMRRVPKIIGDLGYGDYGYVVVNLYPHVETNPDGLPETADDAVLSDNIDMIREAIKLGECEIWAAWGEYLDTCKSASKREYLKRSAKTIIDTIGKNDKWFYVGSLTKSKHPRHPLWLPKDPAKTEFDIEAYRKMLDGFTR